MTVRRCAAQPHVDNARKDVPLDSTGHIGAVLVLNARDGACQRVARRLNPLHNEKTGNYGMKMPPDAQIVEVPTPIGSISFLSANFVHEVLDDEDRLCLSVHLARLPSGRIVYYS